MQYHFAITNSKHVLLCNGSKLRYKLILQLYNTMVSL